LREAASSKDSLVSFLPVKKFYRLEIGDIVHRQLQNGDLVLLNRQPTLHKNSMLAKRIIIRPGKTFRFSLAATKQFNADRL
jgi:DNA-directed RNA polymerase beta' subunit